MLSRIFKKRKTDPPGSGFIKIDEDIISTDFECSLESLTFSSTCEDVFLDRFTHTQTLELLKTSGLLPALNSKGFTSVVADIYKDDTGVHHLNLTTQIRKKNHILVDLRLSFKNVFKAGMPNPMKIDFKKNNFALIEWISLENPRDSFTKEHHPLPGQVRPGLGLLREVMSFIRIVAESSRIDGIIIVPDHFHLAVMYAKYAYFLDPFRQGSLMAVLRDLDQYSIDDISWGSITGTIIDQQSHQSLEYTPAPQIIPVSKGIRECFLSRKYSRLTHKSAKKQSYSLDHAKMLIKRQDLINNKAVSEI